MFSKEGFNAVEYISNGFSNPEPIGTWTDGNNSEMKFVLMNYENENVFLDMDYSVYKNQHVNVIAENTRIDEFYAMGDMHRKIRIPPYCIKGNELSLRFELPDASSPFENGESSDKRKLALLMKNMTLNREHQ